MENLFKDYIIESEKRINSYNFIVFAMKRWYMSLPKVTKELKRDIVDKEAFNKNYLSMLSSLRIGTDAQNLLFKQLVKDFSYSNFNIKLVEDIKARQKFEDFDFVAGATFTSEGFKEALTMAIDDIRNQE